MLFLQRKGGGKQGKSCVLLKNTPNERLLDDQAGRNAELQTWIKAASTSFPLPRHFAGRIQLFYG